MDPAYEPPELESRALFGLKLEQLRNNARIDKSVFTNIASKSQVVSNQLFQFKFSRILIM